MNKILIIIFVLSGLNLFSYDCGEPFYCDPNLKYPYLQCYGATSTIVCSNSPLTLNPKVVFGKMPICLEIVWKDAPGLIKLPTTTGEETVFDNSTFANDVVTAQNNWNCICGKQNTNCSQGCKIKIRFTSNPKEMRYKLAPAEADLIWSYNSTNCTFKCDLSEIRLNNTTGFKGEKVDGYFEYNFCNSNSSYYLKKDSTYNTVNILTAIRHEIGHVLGLDHFNTHNCNGSPEITRNSVMNSRMEEDAPPKELSVYDKCAVAKLHCPSMTPVEEIKIDDDQTYNYPNPTSDFITISIPEINDMVNPLVYKVQIFNMLGIEVMSESIHPTTSSHRMNVEKLPAGVYFIRIGTRVDRVEKFVKM